MRYILFEPILLLFITYTQANNIISHVLGDLQTGYYVIIPFGKEKMTKYFSIDLAFPYSFLSMLFHSANESEPMFKEISGSMITIDNQTYSTVLYSVLTYLSDDFIPIEDFHIHYTPNPGIKKSDSLTFSHRAIESLSLLHSLYQQNKIDRLQFGMYVNRVGYYREGKIMFGGLTKEVIEQNPYSASCKAKADTETWGCSLDVVKFYLNNVSYTYINTYKSSFQTNECRILVPDNFIEHLKTTLFKDYIDKKMCVYADYGMNKRFKCRCDNKLTHTFPNITFRFNNNYFTLGYRELFQQYMDGCAFIIEGNTNGRADWIFGTGFLSNYVELFDYESDTITFYSEHPFTLDGDIKHIEYREIIQYLYMGIIVIEIIEIIELCIKRI